MTTALIALPDSATVAAHGVASPASSWIPHVPLGDWFNDAVTWVTNNLGGLLDTITVTGRSLNSGLTDALLAAPPVVMVLVFAALAWVVRSWQLSLGTACTFLLIVSLEQWDNAMATLALVLLSTLTAIVIAIPLGIGAAKSDRFSAVLKPFLDLMQTMPAFVYLIPSVVFFGIGAAPGMFATVIFAMPPGVRMTELGIRQVDSETVEAGQSFGASGWEILRGIQLPLAVPTIMAGVNQVIMLALSMAVIAGMVGADGLGMEVSGALASMNLSQGLEAGLSIVFLAIFLDRLTAALGDPTLQSSSLVAALRSRRKGARAARA